jgi:dephospho-CoA kinase
MKISDFKFINNGDFSELYKKVDKALRQIETKK